MKRCICLSVVLASALFLYTEIVKAEENHLKSKGSIEADIQLYSEDVEYLKKEIGKLFEECREEMN